MISLVTRWRNFALQFDVAGPFEVNLYSTDKQWRANFWKNIVYPANLNGLEFAIGCYVFCVRRNEKEETKPWYVGKTTATRGFFGEIFQPEKIGKYKEVSAIRHKYKDAVAEMILFPLVTPVHQKVANNKTQGCKKAIEWLEIELISRAIVINPKLKNVTHANKFKTMSVRGVFGKQPQGGPTNAAKYVRDIFQFGDGIKPKSPTNQSK